MSPSRRPHHFFAMALLGGIAATPFSATIGAVQQVPTNRPLPDEPPPPPSILPPDRSPSNLDRTGTDLVPEFPDQTPGTGLDDFARFSMQGVPLADPEEVRRVEDGLIDSIRSIGVPGDRALAAERAIFAFLSTNDWDHAERMLEVGAEAVAGIEPGNLRDIRAVGLLTASVAFVEELIQESTLAAPGNYFSGLFGPATGARVDRLDLLSRTKNVLDQTLEIAKRIGNEDFRSSSLAALAENLAIGAGKVSVSARLIDDSAEQESIRTASVELLGDSERVAVLIPLRVWRYQTLLRVTNAASNAGMFREASPMARRIESPEARVDALIRLAESQDRGGEEAEATRSYQDAFKSVLEIPQQGVRETLARVLGLSLISAGRYEDARVTARYGLSRTPAIELLAEVARAMGEAGLRTSAMRWLDSVPDPILRSRGLRELNNGLSRWIQRNRPLRPGGDYSPYDELPSPRMDRAVPTDPR